MTSMTTLRDGPAIRRRGDMPSISTPRPAAGGSFIADVAFVLALGAGLYLCAIGGLL